MQGTGGPGSIPDQGTRSHMPQPKLKIPHAATKTQPRTGAAKQINKYIFFFKYSVQEISWKSSG